MDNDKKLKIEEKIVDMLKTVYDPEIPVNVYDLGLIYKIDLQDDGELTVDMTLTAPNCPAADFIMEDVRQKLESVEGVKSAQINLVFEPEWDKDMMTNAYGYDEKCIFPFGCSFGFKSHCARSYARTSAGELSGQHQASGGCRVFAGRHVRFLV